MFLLVMVSWLKRIGPRKGGGMPYTRAGGQFQGQERVACMAAASVGRRTVTSHGLVPIAFPRESSLSLGDT